MSQFTFKRKWAAIMMEMADSNPGCHGDNRNFKQRLVELKVLERLDDKQRRLQQRETELDIKQARLERCEKELEQSRAYFVDLWDDVHERQVALKEDEKLLKQGEKLVKEGEK